MIQMLFYISGILCIVMLTFAGLASFERLRSNLLLRVQSADSIANILRLIFISHAGDSEATDRNVVKHALELKTISVYDYLTNPPLQAEVDLALAEFLPRNRPDFKAREPQS